MRKIKSKVKEISIKTSNISQKNTFKNTNACHMSLRYWAHDLQHFPQKPDQHLTSAAR
jgi:hypothetical protein